MVKSIGVDKVLIAVIVMLTLFGIIMVHNSTTGHQTMRHHILVCSLLVH